MVAIGYIIIFGTIFSYLFYLQSLNYIAPATTGMLSSLEPPLTATTLAILLLGVKMSGIELIGSILILATVFLQALPVKSANKEKTISNG
ncbi:EamA family transporter [Lentilactobacillus senioris]|uniref:EamA family transporter n=1 Tax=Lentilactobacillus senioris TaxID=931534 RepID=UPI000A915EEA|nr:EamA family transporter [Lentilactobacillus senioris]